MKRLIADKGLSFMSPSALLEDVGFREGRLSLTMQRVIVTSVLLALGILMPLLAHLFGTGRALLPMHAALMIGSCVLPLSYALFLALSIPLLNHLFTGMPILFPALPVVIFEFSVYVVIIRYCYGVLRCNIFLSLIVAQLLGRLAAALLLWSFSILWHTEFIGISAYFLHLLSDFLPGIALQLLIAPIAVGCSKLWWKDSR